MKRVRIAVLVAGAAAALPALAQTPIYVHTFNPVWGIKKSAWYPPDGLDGDIYAWDAFMFPTSKTVTEVRWMGGYTNFLSGAGKAPVHNFWVSLWPSIAGGFQPNVVGEPLAEYEVGSNAGETLSGTSIFVSVPGGGSGMTPLYNYAFVLPEPFQAQANVKYWVQIVAWQGLTPQYSWPPDWGLPGATGGDGAYFRWIYDGPYQMMQHDLTFTLLGPSCYPDCNGDGNPTIADFGCFQAKFAAADPYADCNESGSLTIADFGCFQTQFVAGCP